MKQEELAQALADRGKLAPEDARDRLDRLVHAIVTKLRRGRPAEMPGVGRLTAKLAGAGSSKPAAAVSRADAARGPGRSALNPSKSVAPPRSMRP